MDADTRLPANQQPFEPVPEAFERALTRPLERALDDATAGDGLRIECRTNDGTPFTLVLDTDPSKADRYAWNLSRGPPSPAPSTYYVLDRGRKYVLVESKASSETELIQEANFLTKSIGGPTATLVDARQIEIVAASDSGLWSRLRRVFDR